MNVLVTGGAGYIGSHTCKALAHAGHTPVTYDNLSRGHHWAVKWGPLEEGDVRDRDRLLEVLRGYRPEAVIHFAAYAYVGESVERPLEYYDNNVNGSLALLEAMRTCGIDRLVFSSSCAVYGTPARLPIDEDQCLDPINPYGATKQMVEQVLADAAAAYGLRSVSLRYFNAAGADPDGELGEEHDPEPHLIPRVLEAALTGTAVAINGDDYDTRDGTCERDYIHVCDLAEAHVRALDLLQSGRGARALNLGTGTGHTVREIVAAAERITGRRIAARIGPRRPGDPAALVADGERARSQLRWTPRHSDLDTILSTSWSWMRTRSEELSKAARHGLPTADRRP